MAGITGPLTDLLHKDKNFVWGKEAEAAFQELKNFLISPPVLRIADPSKPFEVVTDASDFAIGAMLLQDFGNGLQPIAHESRKLQAAKRNYPIHDKEMLAIIHVFKLWRCYLVGADVTVPMDHNPALPDRNCRALTASCTLPCPGLRAALGATRALPCPAACAPPLPAARALPCLAARPPCSPRIALLAQPCSGVASPSLSGVVGAPTGGSGVGQQQQSRQEETLSLQQLRDWVLSRGRVAGAWKTGAGGARAGGVGGTRAAGAGGARAGGTGAASAGGTRAGGVGGTGAASAGGARAGGARAGGAENIGDAGAGGVGAGGTGGVGAGGTGGAGGPVVGGARAPGGTGTAPR
ncbi:unnamed protein product [Closterium sp. NIES-54]